MELKTKEIDGALYAEVQDGKPVYLDDGGKEIAFDAAHATQKITQLTGEATSRRHVIKDLEEKLKGFAGIEDPEAALKALETVQNLDQKKLVDAGEVEAVKAAAVKAMQEKIDAANAEAGKWKTALYDSELGRRFAESKFISENLIISPSHARKIYGDRFEFEDGRPVAKDANGNLIYSSSKPGEPADFDEAFAAIVNADPAKDQILKGRGQSGTGATGGGAGGTNKTKSTQEFQAMSPKQRSDFMAGGGTLVD